MSAIIGTDQYVNYFNNPHGIVQGGIGAALAGGSVIGAIMAGPVSNFIGRRDAIAFACFWWFLGTALQAGCNGIGMLVVGRFINGICVGITSSQVPVYLVEITKKERRGSIVVIQQWAIEWGIFIMCKLSVCFDYCSLPVFVWNGTDTLRAFAPKTFSKTPALGLEGKC